MTIGEMIDRIRRAYGLPIIDGLDDSDIAVIDVLNDMREIGIRVGKRETADTSPDGDDTDGR